MKMRCQNAKKNISLALDARLRPAELGRLQEHLRACPSCRRWQQEQDRLLEMIRTPRDAQPSPDFYSDLRERIAASRPRIFAFSPLAFRPAVLRAAMALVLVFSALLGFFLGGRLETPAAGADAAIFIRTMNLDAFADLPADSFGAVYDRLLQGEWQ